MLRRYHPLIAALSIALLALDALVGALGHSHGDPLAAGETAKACSHHSGDLGHCHSHAADSAEPSRSTDPAPDPHDDCALCRHFSQPVVVVVVHIDVVGSQRIEPFAPSLIERITAAPRPTHPARGPPAVIA